ncbi:MAG: 2-oxoglutarate dehydrogenase complex dihydrolipoyllysine-residue succinyltransferase [Gammaproteobacteria bacterium]|nr:2-oxoglutarate dehydrogenase complex dihydrolipoyllysine-residue succinyltransferase [Gammaproteobacteria bacterium]MBU6509910.1 2-oxoglutarate dehydrogenase complex dihydrolipoyllysine-residue succinyltransferase [Gammaproteobacteria bacterium]MDE1984074.1 2-oxoglutarate dehydrogenase complex dihydrolipoyllysine-residue succinyltransferase [Gammaproteobacteria bacterium]MDE2108790.1 2-oxoglutarate dehydrogenase complex dihydrolipoyllysine-residue succinyltransferase [Gammaproteobacteria bact
MSTEIKVPQLPESIQDATIAGWHKQPGDAVKRDENLVDIETDKVVLECPAPADGVLKEIRQQNGATVTAAQVIGILEEGAVAKPAASAPAAKPAVAPVPPPAAKPVPAAPPPAPAVSVPAAARDLPLSPSVRRLVEEHQLDPAQIKGSGPDGRLTKGDVLDYLNKGGAPAPAATPVAPAAVAVAAPRAAAGARQDRRVPMTRMRARIAERLSQSQANTVMLTSFNEVDLSEVMALRKRYKDKFEKDLGVKLGFMSFFVKAVVEALKKYPAVNAATEGNDIIYHDYWDISVAVSTPRGLVTPVLRDADQMSFAEIEKTLAELATRARDGKISIEELTGGTFTITNGGVFGSLYSTPIINPPQSAILGMHTIKERPVVVDGQIVARPMMYIAITYDHRLIDGREAVLFLVAVKEALEDPARLLLQI